MSPTKTIRYFFEALFAYTLYGLFRILPLDMASGLGGFLGRIIGMWLAKTRKAEKRLQSIFPELSAEERQACMRQMWENIGRVVAEYPHLKQIGQERVEIEGQDILQDMLNNDTGAIIFGIHAHNWEIAATTFLQQEQQPITITYRAPNNPFVEKLLYSARCYDPRMAALPKSRESGRHLLSTLRKKGYIGILIDQKYNEGVEADFLGYTAKTNPVFAQLALRFQCPVVGAYCKRLPGKKVRFSLRFEPPLDVQDQQTGEALPLENVIEQANLMIGKWIREEPGAWLWLHNRWGGNPVVKKAKEEQ